MEAKEVRKMPDNLLRQITELSLSIGHYEQLATVYAQFEKEIASNPIMAREVRQEFQFGGKMIIISPEEIINVVFKKRAEANEKIQESKKRIQEIWTAAITGAE